MDDGLLIFTYHHSREDGWLALVKAIVKNGFSFINVHPIKSEMSVASPKFQAKSPIQLDIVFVCKKTMSISQSNGYKRLKKSFVKSRDKAILAAGKEIEKMGKTSATLDPYSEAASISGVPGDYKISQIADKFLYAKKREKGRSYFTFRSIIRNSLLPHFGNIPMGKLQLEQLEKFRDSRRKQVKDVSIKNDLSLLSMIYNFAIKRKLFSGQNPVAIKELRLKIQNRERYMKESEQARIWAELENQPLLKDLAIFALNTSMRPGNILALTWDRINMAEQEALIPASSHKQDFAGHYLLNNTVLNLLKRRKKESSGELVFYLENGKKIPMKYVQQEWKKACKKAGVSDLHFYDLRHTCLSRLAGNGANVFLLKRVSQHASVQSLEKYVKSAGMTQPALEILNGAKL